MYIYIYIYIYIVTPIPLSFVQVSHEMRDQTPKRTHESSVLNMITQNMQIQYDKQLRVQQLGPEHKKNNPVFQNIVLGLSSLRPCSVFVET